MPANFLEIDVVNPMTTITATKKRFTEYEVRMRVSYIHQNAIFGLSYDNVNIIDASLELSFLLSSMKCDAGRFFSVSFFVVNFVELCVGCCVCGA